jgi:MFS family permease
VKPKVVWGSALAVLFFLAHVFFLPPTLEDLDSMNFALGIRDFDPAKHQPHPPGYPVFIALGKLAHAVGSPEVTALAIWGAVFGAFAVFPLITLFESIDGLNGPLEGGHYRYISAGANRALLATAVVVASPLFWFTSLRPLSDVPGLAVALSAQACFAVAFVRQRLDRNHRRQHVASSGQMIVLGAFLAGLAIGIRTQTVWLTLPLLALVLLDRVGRGAAGAILGSSMTFVIGVLAWAVPLIFASGGLTKYREAFAVQTSEQFHGLDILISNPAPRRLALGIVAALVEPWAFAPLGWLVVLLALVGFASLARRSRAGLVLLIFVVGPYALFHIVVQEMLSRYALPIVPVVGYLAVRGLSAMGGRAAALWGSTAIVIASLLVTLPAARTYAEYPGPAFSAINDLKEMLRSSPDAVIGMHQGMARAVEMQNFGATRILKAPPMRESDELAAYFHERHRAPVLYLADPARTDLELVDPLSRATQRHYTWNFQRERFISGVRPDIVDLVRIDSPPGWFAEGGWHLTSEILNTSERLGRDEGVAFVRSRVEGALLVIGGESTEVEGTNLVGPGLSRTPPAQVSVTIDNRPINRWEVPPGSSFFKRLTLPPGMLSSSSTFNRLVASYRSPKGRPEKIRLTQFAVAPPEALFFIQHAGWNEIEYSPQMQRRWRWTTGRATTFVNSAGRDITLTLSGEAPLRYFDSPPNVSVRAGQQVFARASPTTDFELQAKIPAAALAAADGMITIETDRTFVPSERSESGDRRTLGLRIFTFEIR